MSETADATATGSFTTSAGVPVEDVFEIQNVINRYVHIVDAADWDGLGQVFTEDVTYDMSIVNIGVADGLADLQRIFRQVAHPVAHVVASPVFEPGPDPGTVTVVSKYIIRLESRTVAGGVYADVLVRTPQGWRIRHRRLAGRPASNLR